ncbi:MAG: hypothetical protein CBC12_06955 [Candidatus Puniceispirillum sp. TMED52]|nr:hypothetical protein [SAR116 cluster bacterium]OUU49926.1 MAG: hypothetical protein CBC12_06955 [Candidatus Puniceispirillum sp. TMED52]
MHLNIMQQTKYLCWVILLSAAMLGGAIVMTASAAMAQDADPAEIKIAVVDVNGILEQSEATRKIRAIIDEENQKFLASTEEEQIALRTQEQELDSQKEILDEAEFNRRLKQFQDRVSLLQQKIQRQRREFDLSLQQANEQIRKLLFQIITDIATENGYTLVMQKQNVVLYDSSIDISKEALDRLNDRTKDMTVTFTNKDN